ncbi:hypothetical protein AX15_003616 [Amanita polypyramis BW_CC]|nr:hypothetical protein AX15_003616 [Amanita polypyramis BW_CC]
MLKLVQVVFFFIFAVVTCAQNVVIAAPPAGKSLKAGRKFTIEIDRPNSLSSSLEIGVGIGIASCATRPCFPPEDFVGYVLYHGAYEPTLERPGSSTLYQNFTVKIPSGFPKGLGQLNVVHSALIGAGPIPYIQTLNISVNVV